MANIEEEIIGVILEELGIPREKITLDSKIIADLGADSLDVTELIMKLEEVYSIRIEDEDIAKLTTVGDVVKYIVEKKKGDVGYKEK